MRLQDAEKLMKEKMIAHGLTDYRFEFSRTKRAFGDCNTYLKVIRLSKPLVEINEEATVLKTILHEIAHALTPDHNHDTTWQMKCIEIGGDGKRCKTEANFLERKVNLRCLACNTVIRKAFRKTNMSKAYHKPCGKRTDGMLNFIPMLKWEKA